MWPTLTDISDVTFQPDADVAEEADYTVCGSVILREIPRGATLAVRGMGRNGRIRLTDKGLVPSSQMKTLYPALTWEESHVGHDALWRRGPYRTISSKSYAEGKRTAIIPCRTVSTGSDSSTRSKKASFLALRRRTFIPSPCSATRCMPIG